MGFFIEQPKQRVEKPRFGGCWVTLRIPAHNHARVFAEYGQCSKSPRTGKLTCFHHDKWENEAQDEKARSDARALKAQAK